MTPTPRDQVTRAVPVTVLLATFFTALMGRFTLDRIGVAWFGELDLRTVFCPALVVLVLLWRFRPDDPDYRHSWAPPVRWVLAIMGYLMLTAFWAPYGASVDERLADLGFLALLIVATVVVSGPDPAWARRVVLAATYITGLLYALAGLILGQTDAQGRTIAFGGGPNVYVRVLLVAVIAAVALSVIYRRKLFLLPVPVLGVAALLAGSRGGVAAAVTTAVFVVLCRRRLSWRVGAAAVLAAGAGLVATTTLLDTTDVALIQKRFVSDLFQEHQFSGRPELLGQALKIFLANPLFGGGLDSFHVRFGYSENLGYPHNLVVDVAATGGLVGLGLLVAFSVSLVRHVRPWGQVRPDQLAMLMGMIFVAAASMFSGDFYDSRFLWMFAVLAVNHCGWSVTPDCRSVSHSSTQHVADSEHGAGVPGPSPGSTGPPERFLRR